MVDAVLDVVDKPLREFHERIKAVEARAPEKGEKGDAGLIGPPMVIATVLAGLYARFGDIDALRRALAGVACAAVGLLIAVVLRMMWPLIKKRDALGMLILVAVFIAIGVLQLPLHTVVLVAIPLSLVITYFLRMRGAA